MQGQGLGEQARAQARQRRFMPQAANLQRVAVQLVQGGRGDDGGETHARAAQQFRAVIPFALARLRRAQGDVQAVAGALAARFQLAFQQQLDGGHVARGLALCLGVGDDGILVGARRCRAEQAGKETGLRQRHQAFLFQQFFLAGEQGVLLRQRAGQGAIRRIHLLLRSDQRLLAGRNEVGFRASAHGLPQGSVLGMLGQGLFHHVFRLAKLARRLGEADALVAGQPLADILRVRRLARRGFIPVVVIEIADEAAAVRAIAQRAGHQAPWRLLFGQGAVGAIAVGHDPARHAFKVTRARPFLAQLLGFRQVAGNVFHRRIVRRGDDHFKARQFGPQAGDGDGVAHAFEGHGHLADEGVAGAVQAGQHAGAAHDVVGE